MAVVQRNQAQDNVTNNSSRNSNESRTAEVDLDKILAMGSVGPKRVLDATEDAWERSAPIAPGRYTVKAFFAKDKPKMGFYDEAKKEPWFTLGLECKIQADDPEVNNVVVFAGVSTRINQRKKISTAAGLIVKYGFKLPPEASDIEIVKLVKLVLSKERPIDVEVDWKAGYFEADNNWVSLANSYEDFPDNPEGGKDYVIKVTRKDGGKEDVRARLFISHWYGKDEPKVASTSGAKTNGKIPTLVDDEPNTAGFVANRESVKSTPSPKGSQPAVSDDDALAALLEG